MTFTPNALNTPVYMLTTGNVTIAGTINVNGGNATTTTPGTGGPGGFNGGYAYNQYTIVGGAGLGPGGGPGGGPTTTPANLGGSGSYAGVGTGNTSSSTYGNVNLLPLIGGSGGGGGYNGFYQSHGGGGGGAILIASTGTITATGNINALGGNGYSNGGVGSAGAIRLVANGITGTGSINASSAAGGIGRVYLQANNFSFYGTSNPMFTYGIPSSVFGSAPPSITITSVGNVNTPAVPTGSYGAPDITLPNTTTNPVPVSISAVNIPVGTTFSINVIPQGWTSKTIGADLPMVTTIRGRVLNTKKEPVANVTVSYKNLSVKTGADGTFHLNGIPEGRRTLLIDGSTATDIAAYYPAIPVSADITAGSVAQLSFTPHLHHQKHHNFVDIASGQETVVTDSDMKGYEMRIPKGTRIVGWDGKVNNRVSMRTVPPDRLPIRPLPDNSHVRSVTMFFFDKVGGGRPDQPIPFKSPNTLKLKPGEKATLWYYDESSVDGEAPNDWSIAGAGTVSRDGRFIETDPGVGIPKFCCGASGWGGLPDGVDIPVPNGQCPDSWGDKGPGPFSPKPGTTCAVDPVDVSTGYFFHNETDMVVPGIIPINIKRYYVSRLGGSAVTYAGSDGLGAFGKGMSFEFDWRVDQSQDMIRLTKPGGSYFDFAGVPRGGCAAAQPSVPVQYAMATPEIMSDAIVVADGSGPVETCNPPPPILFFNSTNPEFVGARIDIITGFNNNRVLTTRDGWKYVFENSGGLISLTDNNGNTLTITRHYDAEDTAGYITKITNSEGKSVVFNQSYVGDNFIQTNAIIGPDGRVVNYVYETDPFSAFPRLSKVIKPDNTIIKYGYDNQGRMNTLTDGNGVVKFTNVYDANNRVVSQTNADGSFSTFNYSLAGGSVAQTNLTTPNGAVTSWRFNAAKYGSEYTSPDGTTVYNMDSLSNRILSITDPLNRTTSYTYYDGAVVMNGMVSSITDPLNNVTSFGYNILGLTTGITNSLGLSTNFLYTIVGSHVSKATIVDPLSNQIVVNYNSFGMPISVTDANNNTTTLVYDATSHSQLLSITDPLGNTAKYAYDASGRVTSVTDAKGATTSFNYDNADQVISSTDAKGNTTVYSYDNNGNLLALTDVVGGFVIT